MPLAGSVGERFAAVVADGPMPMALLVSALAGVVSFLSPCVLPLVPGYLSYITGMAGAEASSGAVAVLRRSRTVIGAVLFVLGFTAVFVSYGLAFGNLGGWLYEYQPVLQRVLGAVTVVMGLGFLGLLPVLQREVRVRRLPAAGLAGAPLLGALFGIGWTPCIGPTLGAVQALAFDAAAAGKGAVLSAAYSLGLGVPFVLAALGLRRGTTALALLRRHSRAITRVGGVMLVAIGVLLLTGWWDTLTIQLRVWSGRFGTVI